MNLEAKATVKQWRRRKAVWGACVALGAVISALLLASCGSQVLEGESAAYLIVDGLSAASGADPEEYGTVLHSDVITLIEKTDPITGKKYLQPTVFSDPAKIELRLALKDPGPQSTPTTNNLVTITRYRVVFTRTDGRNTPGEDVPYPFDGTVTFTVTAGGVEAGFLLVRLQAKEEAPLQALGFSTLTGGGAFHITTNADVTFFGHDQTGRLVNVSARMTVIFSDFGDPE
jgi:hypothetical protein